MCVFVCPHSVLRAQSVAIDEVEIYMFPEMMEINGFNTSGNAAASISVPQLLLEDRSKGKAKNIMLCSELYVIFSFDYAGGSVGVASVLFRNLQAFLPNESYVPPMHTYSSAHYIMHIYIYSS